MSPRRSSSHLALLVIMAVLSAPGFVHGQRVAGTEIDRTLFLVATKAPDGKWTVRETDRVPLRPRQACYGWRLHFSSNTLGALAWRAEFTLPAQPGKDPTLLVTKKSEQPRNGWLGHTWCVTRGDPVGLHVIRVYVQDSLAKAFTFFVMAPEDLIAQDPAGGGAVPDVPPVDPLAELGDFSTQRASLEDELAATYAKPPNRLDTDPAASSVLLVDIDLKGALGRVDGATLVTRGDGGRLIRAAPLKGGLVMFHTLEPGSYSLQFIRVENFNPSQVLALEKPPSIEINVTVARGGVSYVGTVVVSRKKAGLFGFKPPEFQLTYDARRELEAWSAFKKKYADSPWTALADRRVVALRSPERAQEAAVAPPASGDPLGRLGGEWGLTVFVMGAGRFGGPKCGKSEQPGPPPVTVAPSGDGAVSFAATCDDGSSYAFRLSRDSTTRAYLLTVTSAQGISVQDLPVAYVEGQGWQGKRDQVIDGAPQSISGIVGPIEGRNWYGWMIEVLPTAGIGREDDLKQPFVRVDLTRRK